MATNPLIGNDLSQYADQPTNESVPVIGNDLSQYADQPANESVTQGSTQVQQPSISAPIAAGLGFANSASFGLGKWVSAMMGQPLSGANNALVPNVITPSVTRPIPNMTLADAASKWWNSVLSGVRQQQANNTSAFQQHPAAYIAGSAAPAVIGAAAGTPVAPIVSSIPAAARGAPYLAGIPYTAGKAAVLGAGIGALNGAAESTTGKQLVSNIATGAALGAGFSGITTGVSNLVTNVGTKGALSAINSIIKDAQSTDADTSTAALEKLHNLYASPNPSYPTLSKAELLDAAGRTQYALKNPKQFLGKSTVGGQVSQLAPSFGQIGRDVIAAAPGAAMIAHGSQLGGVPGAIFGTAGAMLDIKPAGTLLKDVASKGSMWYAGKPWLQRAVQAGSPLAGGGLGGSSQGPGVANVLGGMLGSYISNVWGKL